MSQSRHDTRHDRDVTIAFPHREDLSDLLSSSKDLMSDIEARDNFSVLAYLISNCLNESQDLERDLVLLSRAIQRIPQATVIRLFESYSLSLRAIWDQFMRSPIPDPSRHDRSMTEVRANMALYITTTLSFNPEWVVGHEDKLLIIASSLSSHDLVSKLLDIGACPSLLSSTGPSSIISAIQAGAHHCVKLQVESCNINDNNIQVPSSFFYTSFELTTSLFVLFLDCAIECFRRPHGLNKRWESQGRLQNRSILAALEFFLKNGADVDAPYPPALCLAFQCKQYYHDCPHPPPSCLEIAFYCYHVLYENMEPFSRRNNRQISRITVCNAAARGKQYFATYLNEPDTQDNLDKQSFSQMILFELVFMRAQLVEISTAHTVSASNGVVIETLIECGITLPRVPSDESGIKLTSAVMARIASCALLRRTRFTERSSSILSSLKHLFQLSGEIDSRILRHCIDADGTTILRTLAECNDRFSSSVPINGGYAVVMAALRVNCEVVSMLLEHGFPVNSEFVMPGYEDQSVRTAVGHTLRWAHTQNWLLSTRLAAVRCLVQHGAAIRLHRSDRTCFELLDRFIHEEPQNIFTFFLFLKDHYPLEPFLIPHKKWECLLQGLSKSKARSTPGSNESALKIFETIMEDNPGLSCRLELLAAVIVWGGRRDLIQRLISEGADVNVLCGVGPDDEDRGLSPLRAAVSILDADLVVQLLQLGAKMEEGILSVAVSATTSTRKDEMTKMTMISSMVDQGADVNSHSTDGLSPLHYCAKNGNMDCAAFLLKRGADPNAVHDLPVCISGPDLRETPLDLAAEFGRLDMAQLFLMTGGLSATRGATGYDGAVKRAEDKGFSAIVELIRRHITAVPA